MKVFLLPLLFFSGYVSAAASFQNAAATSKTHGGSGQAIFPVDQGVKKMLPPVVIDGIFQIFRGDRCVTPYRVGNRYRLRLERCEASRRDQRFQRWGREYGVRNVGLQNQHGVDEWCMDLENGRTRDGTRWILWPCKTEWNQRMGLPMAYRPQSTQQIILIDNIGGSRPPRGGRCMVVGHSGDMEAHSGCDFPSLRRDDVFYFWNVRHA
jgi:hypothetical protein